jgi:hypothetical protein
MSNAHFSAQVEPAGQRVQRTALTHRPHTLPRVVSVTQQNGAEPTDPLPLHRFLDADIPVVQYDEAPCGATKNEVSQQANARAAKVKQSGPN